MSDSSGITSPVQSAIQGRSGSGGSLVRIINLPQDVASSAQNSPRAYRLDGQVTSQNPSNNTAQIQTNQGTIDVQFRGNQRPEVGQRLEIEIPNTRQPREASIIRTDSPRAGQQAPTQNTPSSQNFVPTREAQQSQNQVPTASSRAQSRQPVPNSDTQLATRLSITPESIRTPPRTDQVNLPPAPNRGTTTTQTSPQSTTQVVAQTASNLLQTARNIAGQLLPNALQNVLGNTQALTTATPSLLTPTQETNVNTITRINSAESLVRLLAVPPAQAQNIARDFIQTLQPATNNTLNVTESQNNTTALNNVGQSNLTAFTTSPNISSAAQIQNQITNQTPLNQTLGNQTTTQQQTTILPSTISSANQSLTQAQTLPTNTNISFNASGNINSVTPNNAIPQNATLTPLPVTFDPSNPTQNIGRPVAQIDIQIIQTTPPDVNLRAPLNNALPPPSPIPAATNFTPPLIGFNNAVSLNAQVTGFTQQGLPLVTVQGLGGRLPQSFVLQQANPNLQLGTQLQIVPQNTVAVASRVSPVTLQTFNNPLLQGFQWPALDQLYNTLQQLSPQAASALSRSLPNAASPTQITAAAMIFIAAVKTGNFEMLLNDKKMDMLQQAGRSNILSGLSQDGIRAGAPEAAVQNDWRAVPLPMFWEGEIHKITLYTRQENFDDGQNNQGENGQARFIFDLNLSRMGDVQIDGLLKDKRLDLVLRTQHAFSEPMQQTMRRAYSGALTQTELTGELNFQGSTENWVHVLEKEEQLGVNA